MKRRMILATLATMGLPGLVGGCSAGEPQETGTLQMELMAYGSSGTTYGLAATFTLSDPERLSVTSSETDLQSSLSMNPRVGDYALTLCENGMDGCPAGAQWRLFELRCANGLEGPIDMCMSDPSIGVVTTPVVGATLVTSNPLPVSIEANQTTTAVFRFVVPGQGTVVFARGGLNIVTEVQEGFSDGAPCTQAVECQSHVCAADATGSPVCQVPTCTDGVQNGGEAGPDCGLWCPTACPGTGPRVCLYAEECEPNEICVGADPLAGIPGECAPGVPGMPCLDGGQCLASEVCVGGDPALGLEGVCTPLMACLEDFECPAPQVCVAADPAAGIGGVCGTSGSGILCNLGIDCPAGEVCVGENPAFGILGICIVP
jgi:hypothetical protein